MRVNLNLNKVSSILFPPLCLTCNCKISNKEQSICLECDHHLPRTNFHVTKENKFTERFWGRIKLNTAAAMYYFNGNEQIKKLIYGLKYQSKTEIGERIGNIFGRRLLVSPHFSEVDMILPVPLHWTRQRDRGYNQSDFFAKGLAETMVKPWFANYLKRTKETSSQTRKNVMERIENVSDIFEVPNPKLLEGRHILLVDDVVTTGATLEACAETILKIPGTTVSFATMAIAV